MDQLEYMLENDEAWYVIDRGTAIMIEDINILSVYDN